MPISPIVIQRRHAELGRIRLGQKGDRGQPQKLAAFRFTSPSERYIKDLAELYGGVCQAWDNAGKPEFEVFSTAKSIPVYAVKGGLSQWLEYWLGGGVAHRCDGERDVEGNLCDPDMVVTDSKNRKHYVHRDAKPTTRLSVMLPELEAIGVFRMESHGWNAAAEIPAVAELAAYVGPLVPANLHLVERRAVKDGQTSRFVVPVLDLQIGAAKLRELAEAMSSGRELTAVASTPQIEASAGGGLSDEDLDAMDVDQLREAWKTYTDEPTRARITQRVDRLKAAGGPAAGDEAAARAAASSPHTPDSDPDGVVEGEVVEPDADLIWQQIMATAGRHGMTTPDLEDDVRTFLGGTTAAEASGSELAEYLEDLSKRPVERAS